MADPDIQEAIRSFLATRCGIPFDEIAPHSRFADDLLIDSFDLVALLIEIEDRYGVVVTDSEAAQLETVGQAAEFIAARRESTGS